MPPPTITLRFDTSPLAAAPLFRRLRGRRPRLDPPPLRDDVRRMAARGWEDRAKGEYTGVMIVRRLHGLLVDLNAPADLQEAALVMMAQEQRHVGLCMDAARALGHDGALTFDLPSLQQPRTRQPLDEQLLDMVVGTYCVGEVVAHALLRYTLDALPPSGFRDTHRLVLRDEVLHARIGPALLGVLGGDPAPLYARHVAYMRQRDVIELDEAALFEDPEAAAQLRSVGIPPPRGLLDAYHRALDVIAAG